MDGGEGAGRGGLDCSGVKIYNRSATKWHLVHKRTDGNDDEDEDNGSTRGRAAASPPVRKVHCHDALFRENTRSLPSRMQPTTRSDIPNSFHDIRFSQNERVLKELPEEARLEALSCLPNHNEILVL